MSPIFFRAAGRVEWWGVALALTVMGLAMQYSLAFSGEQPVPEYFWRQLIAAVVALVVAWLVSKQDYHVWSEGRAWWYALVLALLIAVLLFGRTVNGTRGWFALGPVQFQPVEIIKVFVALGVAGLVATWTAGSPSWRQLLTSMLYVAVPFFLVAAQPDMGSAMLLWTVWAVLVWLGGIRWRQVAVLVGGVLMVALVAWLLLLRPYQKERVLVFFNPSRAPLGSGYQVRQAIIAVGSGGFLGKGLGRGTQTQLKFLPDARTDFVFAALAEELGLVGIAVVFILFGLLLRGSWWAGANAANRFMALSIGGLTGLIIMQAALNIAMNIGWSPVVGVPLPFLSYGGSSLIGSWLTIGVLQSFVRQRT